MPTRICTLLLAAALAAGAVAAQAQEKKAQKAQETKAVPAAEPSTAMCIGCHGIPGYKTAFPEVYHVPKIAGQQAGYIAAALKAYRAGQRSHPSMRGIAASLTDAEIDALAAHYGAPAK